MKKTLAILLAALMLVSISACGKKAPDAVPADTPTSQPSNESGNAPKEGTDNPWVEISADDVFNYLGFRFCVPEGATNVIYRWLEKDGIAEMQFTFEELNFTARAKRTDALEDISGLHYDFSNNNDNYGHGPDCFIWNSDQELRGDYHLLSNDDGCISLGLWYYVSTEGSYSLSLSYVSDAFCGMSQYASEVFLLESTEGDPTEYSMDFWAAKYPGENVCPFYIEVDGVEYSYYRISGLDEGTMMTWINTPLNWNGWHLVGNDIVNGEETYKMTSDWIGEDPEQSFSSGCTVTTEPYDPSASTAATETTGYNFKGYTETADWPGEDCWKFYGLPRLPMSDDVNGSVHISDKEWIYPLNGSDGIMIEARPSSSQIDAIVTAILDEGIDMQEDPDFEKGYTGYYMNGSNEMKITISETSSGKLAILIITNPTD